MDVVFNKVSKRFGKNWAIENLSFTAESGKVTGLLGRNGAGKTSALRVLVGLQNPTEGTATIGGSHFDHLPVGTVGVALAPFFPPLRTVMQQLSLSALAGGATRADIERALAETELTEVAHKRCMSLSLGMKQRLLLACATVFSPKVLILDEPVNGLDPDGIAWLHKFLRSQASQGVSVLVSSHFLHDLQTYVDKVVIIQRTALWESAWPAHNGESLESLFSRVTAGIGVA
jgi:ABC-2 type transport system ATP-binding protein